VRVTKEDLNQLVMNFFVTEGYLEAARAFAKESATEPGADLDDLTVSKGKG
jgi:glucose-induced degradation protein 8